MSQDTERLSDTLVANLATYAADAKPTTPEVESLAREVQASRKLAADLRRVHYQKKGKDFDWCNECQIGAYPCLTVALIDEAGL